MLFPKFNEYRDFNSQELNKINPLFSQAFEKFIFGLRLLNQLTESWNVVAPLIASRKATVNNIKKYKELTNSFNGPVANCLFTFIREKVPKNNTCGKEYVNSTAGIQLLKQFHWFEMYKQDIDNLIKNDFLSKFNEIIIYTSYVIQRQLSDLSQGEDSNYQLIDILPKFESNFETIYNDLSDQIQKENNPYVAHDISFGHKGKIHTKKEILYQCTEKTGNEYIKRITTNGETPITIYDIFNVYRDFYGILYEFIEEGIKVSSLIPIFNTYYEKPSKIYKEYIDKNFKFCLNIVQKTIPKYITETNSHNFFIDIEKVCLTNEHKEILNKTKNFFDTAHLEADKKRKELRKNDDYQRELTKNEPKLNDTKRYIQELKTHSKSDNYFDYQQARDRLCSQIPVLEKMKLKEADDLINEIHEILDETGKEENRFKNLSFYKSHEPSIRSIINLLREAIDNKDANLIAPYKNSLKEQINSLNTDINDKFDGDRDSLKNFEPLKNLINEANELLEMKIGGKSAECLQAEKIYLVQVNAYLPSIDMMCNVQPNQTMIPSLNMMKTQLDNLSKNLVLFKDESIEIKEAIERINEGITKLDSLIIKCSNK